MSQKKILPNGTFLAGGTPDYINRPPSPTNGTIDIAKKAIILSPGTSISPNYIGNIDPNAPSGISINGLQTIDFQHHIRGWLKGINLDNNQNPIPKTSDGDLFSYKLDYETAGFFDGNIGKQSWANVNSNVVENRNYSFNYDPSKRLKSATFVGINNENYSLPLINYDKNGNIFNLQRNGAKNASFGMMDDLTYTYSGNRLTSVSDAIAGNHEVDFVPRGNQAYTYYPNGDLKSDANEQISNITYNTFLKQPELITLTDGRWYRHYYDGGGRIIKTVYSNGETWNYIEGNIFKNGQFYQIPIPEGRATFTANAWQNEFFYYDHIGNTRVSFKPDGANLVKTAETSFDPWGVVLKGIGQINSTQNRFEYQNKEKESTFGLNRINLGARTYNPTIGRLDKVDKKSEKWSSYSPYNYVLNRPNIAIDPDGNDVILYYKDSKGDYKTYDYKIGSSYNGKSQFVRDFYHSMARLNNKGAGEIFKSLEEHSEKVWVKETSGKSSYSPRSNVINWDSRMGVYTENGTALSPTTVLNHEGDHALDHLTRGNDHNKTTKDDKYDNSEERRVITKSEQVTAKKLGEIKDNEITRDNHRGQPFTATSSTSTEEKNTIVIKPKN